MVENEYKLDSNYWGDLTISKEDFDFLLNYLFEKEIPLGSEELAKALIHERIEQILAKEREKQSGRGTIFVPKDEYILGQQLVFPALDWKQGKVVNSRDSNNPDIDSFSVISVHFTDGTIKEFASNLGTHSLNDPNRFRSEVNIYEEEKIINQFGMEIQIRLDSDLKKHKELVKIGGKWFPKSLLVDFNQGHLNIAEAILDMQNGGPIGTNSLLKQLDLGYSDNQKLMEFSLNYALQEDPRFDEVGPKGEFSWFLRRLEPGEVLTPPLYLEWKDKKPISINFSEDEKEFLLNIDDELIQIDREYLQVIKNSVTLTLSFPHWRAGSIPLTQRIKQIFPDALETERVKIEIIDKDSGASISAWVVRLNNYVIGLKNWYDDMGLMPGSIITLEANEESGNVFIQAQKKRSNREWIKTVLVGADGGLVLALLKQSVNAGFSERMAIAIPDVVAVDNLWNQRINKQKPLKTDINKMISELAKLNQQHHVHFLELYSAINIIRRCPPDVILDALLSDQDFVHVGDHYFNLKDDN